MYLGFDHFQNEVIGKRRKRIVVVPMYLTIAALRGDTKTTTPANAFATIPDNAIVTDFKCDPRQGIYHIEFSHFSFEAVPGDQDIPTTFISGEVGEEFVLPERRQVKRLCLTFEKIIDAFSGKLDLRTYLPENAVLVNVSFDNLQQGLQFLIAHPSFDPVPITEQYPSI